MNVSSEMLAKSSFYQSETERVRSHIPVLRTLQQQGLADLRRLGFPSKRDEDWRYTSVDHFLKHAFHTAQEPGVAPVVANQTDVPWGMKLTYVDGCLFGLEDLCKTLPSGVLILPILEALSDHPEKIVPYLGKILNIKNGFQAQNTAMLHCGLFIYVPKNICLSEPILLVHRQTRSDQAVYYRHVVVLESDAKLKLIEDYQSEEGVTYYTNTVSECDVGPQAQLSHYRIQREGQAAYHVGQLAVRAARAAHVDSHVFSLGGQWSRLDACFYLEEPYAQCQLNGIYLLKDNQHMDHHTWVYHQVPHCTSEQNYKGILSGHARGVFNGQVHVAQHAQKTIARQQNKNLVLSKHAEIDTKPQLDIAADDVQCTHGATVGQLDEDALFYFATRGIEKPEAIRYLIQAFAAELLQAIGYEPFASWMGVVLNQHLGSNYEL